MEEIEWAEGRRGGGAEGRTGNRVEGGNKVRGVACTSSKSRRDWLRLIAGFLNLGLACWDGCLALRVGSDCNIHPGLAVYPGRLRETALLFFCFFCSISLAHMFVRMCIDSRSRVGRYVCCLPCLLAGQPSCGAAAPSVGRELRRDAGECEHVADGWMGGRVDGSR